MNTCNQRPQRPPGEDPFPTSPKGSWLPSTPGDFCEYLVASVDEFLGEFSYVFFLQMMGVSLKHRGVSSLKRTYC